MSKHSMRRGSAGKRSTSRSVSSASNAGRRAVAEVRLIGQRRVARRQVEQPALLAALRHDEPDAAAGALGQPGLDRLALVGRQLDRNVDFGRRLRVGVELLDARRSQPALASRPASGAASRVAGVRSRHELDAIDHPAAPHLEDLRRRRRPVRP